MFRDTGRDKISVVTVVEPLVLSLQVLSAFTSYQSFSTVARIIANLLVEMATKSELKVVMVSLHGRQLLTRYLILS